MVDMIVELANDNKYLILDETILKNVKYYYGLRLDLNEEPTNNYLFFEESKEGSDTFLTPMFDENVKGLLLTAFTVNFLVNSPFPNTFTKLQAHLMIPISAKQSGHTVAPSSNLFKASKLTKAYSFLKG